MIVSDLHVSLILAQLRTNQAHKKIGTFTNTTPQASKIFMREWLTLDDQQTAEQMTD